MNAAALAFRFRVAIFLLLYLVGFLPPWGASFRGGSEGTLWLAASTLAARSGWIGLAAATVTVTLIALACLDISELFADPLESSALVVRDAQPVLNFHQFGFLKRNRNWSV